MFEEELAIIHTYTWVNSGKALYSFAPYIFCLLTRLIKHNSCDPYSDMLMLQPELCRSLPSCSQSASSSISERSNRHTMTRCPKTFTKPVLSCMPLPSRRPSIAIFQSFFRSRQLKPGCFTRLDSTMTENHRVEYNWVRGVETLEKYQCGGYHPIMIGDVLNDRYHIVDKLGFGGYSTVWLALDTNLKRYVAVKVNIADSLPRETKVLKALSSPFLSSLRPGHGLVPVLLDEFNVQGPNGKHTCYTVTPAQCNLREISFSRLFSLKVARALSYGLTQAVAYTHSQGYVHGGLSCDFGIYPCFVLVS